MASSSLRWLVARTVHNEPDNTHLVELVLADKNGPTGQGSARLEVTGDPPAMGDTLDHAALEQLSLRKTRTDDDARREAQRAVDEAQAEAGARSAPNRVSVGGEAQVLSPDDERAVQAQAAADRAKE